VLDSSSSKTTITSKSEIRDGVNAMMKLFLLQMTSSILLMLGFSPSVPSSEVTREPAKIQAPEIIGNTLGKITKAG